MSKRGGGPSLEKDRLPASFQKKELYRDVSGGKKHLTCTVCLPCVGYCVHTLTVLILTQPCEEVWHLPSAGQKTGHPELALLSHAARNSGAGWMVRVKSPSSGPL